MTQHKSPTSAQPPATSDQRPLRIIHVDAERHFSGGQVQLLLLIDGLAAHGHHNLLLCPPGSGAAVEAARRGLAVATVSMRGDIDFLAVRRLARRMTEAGAD